MGIGRLGSPGPQWIDDDHLGATFTGLFDDQPQVAVGDHRVGAPEDDQPSLGEVFWI
jgi:hypothetical protein